MKLLFNLQQLYRILLASFKGGVTLNEEIETHYIVWPWLTEFFRTLQASEFTQMTDSARWEFAVRAGLVSKLWKLRSYAVVASQKTIYRRSIPLMSRVRITVKMEGAEKNWVYIKHKFYTGKELCAISWVKLSVKNHKGSIDTSVLFPKPMTPPNEVIDIFGNDAAALKSETL